MTDIAASTEQNHDRWREQIETLAITVCRIKRLPDPDPHQRHLLVSEASGLFPSLASEGAKTLPEPVYAFVAAWFRCPCAAQHAFGDK